MIILICAWHDHKKWKTRLLTWLGFTVSHTICKRCKHDLFHQHNTKHPQH